MKSKKIVAIILSIVLALSALSFVGCTGAKDVLGLEIDEDCYVNRKLNIGYARSTYESTLENIAELSEIVETEDGSDLSCQLLCIMVATKMYKLIDAVNVSRLYYYTNMSDETNQAGYTELYEMYTKVLNEFKKLYEPFANSKYKTLFYGEDITDEEIAELVAQAVTSDTLVALENTVVDIQNRYNDLSQEEIFTSSFSDIYTELVETKNLIAAEYEYSDYMAYSYEREYDREFTPSDTLAYSENLGGNLIGAAETAYDNAKRYALNANESELNEVNAILDDYFLSENSLNVLDGFYRSLGDEIYGIFKQVINKGYFFIANNPNAFQRAYTSYFVSIGEPFMYFSTSYATVDTFVHEFGHYLRYYFGKFDLEGSYELLETHSQGAEWLFMSYLDDVLESADADYLINSKFVTDVYSVLMSATVGASEVEIYELTDLSEVNYDEIITKWSNKIFGETIPSFYVRNYTPVQYFKLVSVDTPGYYISYSVSMISSLELYVQSQSSYEDAVNSYVNLLKSEDYVDALIENGLTSPLEKQTITNICNAFIAN